MIEQIVTIESTFKIKGTLTIPGNENEKSPAILIIAGSGNGDRDGNVKGLNMNLYKDLANFLTKLGFVTLRYDKRGVNESEGNFLEAGIWDFIEDAKACLQFLKNCSSVDSERITILGHSEGALLAPAVYHGEDVAGLILLAGAAEPSETLFPKQREMAKKEIAATKGFKGWLYKRLKVIEKMDKQQEAIMGKIMSSTEPMIKIKGIKYNAKWIREQFEYNVVDYLQKVTVPVLAITGDKDIQVPPEHVKKMAEYVQGEAEWHIIPNMNHLFKKYEKEHTILGIMKEYKGLIAQPTDPDLLNHLEKWLTSHFLQDQNLSNKVAK